MTIQRKIIVTLRDDWTGRFGDMTFAVELDQPDERLLWEFIDAVRGTLRELEPEGVRGWKILHAATLPVQHKPSNLIGRLWWACRAFVSAF